MFRRVVASARVRAFARASVRTQSSRTEPPRKVVGYVKPTSFTLFLKQNKNNKKLHRLSVPDRGRQLGKMWRELPAEEKLRLKIEAAARPAVYYPRRRRKVSEYHQFVKTFLRTEKKKSLAGKTNAERFKAAADAWHKHRRT